MSFGRRPVLLPRDALLPAAWHGLAAAGPFACFNPGLLACDDGWLLAYRVVGADRRRRLAICRLDPALRPVAGSAVPLSDALVRRLPRTLPERARAWFADPRLYRLDGRPHVYWNSGWHEPNFQFLQALDPASLMPCGPARELRLAGPRQAIEKNWMLLGDTLARAVYLPAPHRMLELADIAPDALLWRPCPPIDWDVGVFAARYGPLRGGAPPQRRGDSYVSVCHSVFATALGFRYVGAAYRFAAAPPFAPLAAPARPLPLPVPPVADLRRILLDEATHRVVYASGAAWRDGAWVVSYGIDDTHCALAVLPDEAMDAAMRPLPCAAAGAA